MQLMRTAQAQITLVLRNQELVTTSQASAEESLEQAFLLSLLNDLMQRANTETDEIRLLADTAKVLHEATGLNHVGIGLISASGMYNEIVAEYPDAGSVGNRVEAKGGGIPDLLTKSRRALVITDIENNETLLPRSRDSLAELGVKSAIFLPMFDLDGNLIGTVGLDSFEKVAAFPPKTIEAAETIVSQIAVNLQKLRLLHNSQSQATQLQQIADFGQAMQASLQIEEILNTVLTYRRQVIAAD
jgi:GAF domain-containing protein